MIRGTTPTLEFVLPFECREITKLNIAIAQNDAVVLEKELPDCSLNGRKLSVTLTEDETLLLDCHVHAKIQIRCACGETKMACDPICVDVGEILKDGCLE